MLRSFSALTLKEAMLLVPAENVERWQITAPPRPPSATLTDNIQRFQVFDVTNSEAAKFLYMDALFAEVVPHHPPLKIWKSEPLESEGLVGIADYLIAPRRVFVAIPLLCVAEAKKDDFVQGRAQCVGEMVACRENNRRDNRDIDVYGIVSNGQDWQFYKLTPASQVWESKIYPLENLDDLLGALHQVCAECAQNAIAV